MRINYVVMLFLLFSLTSLPKLKLLHLSFHIGCTNDFDDVAKELGIEVTNWIPSDQVSFQGKYLGNALYNISRERGREIWNMHKRYFNQFDVVMTSDTARLSRIFLENGWQKPLIVWICNRFDYYDRMPPLFGLPDKEYYDTFRAALTKKKVQIVSYTPYEYHYARNKGVPFTDFTIKPVGCLPEPNTELQSRIPTTVDKANTFFLYPRLGKAHSAFIEDECKKEGIPIYTGLYSGPDDLTGFKGVLYFPYAWSNFALFENIQRGIIHFVPSEEFIKKNHRKVRYLTLKLFNWCEWYISENRDLFVYFDSWQDLKKKMATLNYDAQRNKIVRLAHNHRSKMVNRWRTVFAGLSA